MFYLIYSNFEAEINYFIILVLDIFVLLYLIYLFLILKIYLYGMKTLNKL